MADVRRNHRIRSSSHENDLQSNNESTIRPNTTRAVLHPKSRKGVLHQFGFLQQHRIDRLLADERPGFIQLPRRNISKKRQANGDQEEDEDYYKILPLDPLPGSDVDFTDMLMDMLVDDPEHPPVPDLQAFTRQLILPRDSAERLNDRVDLATESMVTFSASVDRAAVSGREEPSH